MISCINIACYLLCMIDHIINFHTIPLNKSSLLILDQSSDSHFSILQGSLSLLLLKVEQNPWYNCKKQTSGNAERCVCVREIPRVNVVRSSLPLNIPC